MPTAPASFAAEKEKLDAVRKELARVIVGQEKVVDQLLIALLCGGHVLIEGVPGLAKTLLVSSLAQTLHTSFNRIQFTPDLLPGDLIGTQVFHPKTGDFHIQRGPIFANLVLADEINRSPAKVQSALLEAMQEKQVSIGNQTFPLSEPFMVLATQNPIEQEGTYPLPEAQLDRFFFKILVGYPSLDQEREIMRRMGKNESPPICKAVLEAPQILEVRRSVDRVFMKENVEQYILQLIDATRHPLEHDLDSLGSMIRHGASPRATIYLAKASRTRALMGGRDYVVPSDVKAVAHEVLRHRIALSYKALAQNLSTDDVIELIFQKVPVPG